MQQLESIDILIVRHLKEWGEVISDQKRNSYEILDKDKRKIFDAREAHGSMLSKQLLRQKRPFTLTVLESGTPMLTLKRPFRFFIHTIKILNRQGGMLGSIKKTFNPVQRNYTIRDRAGQTVCKLRGPALKPWMFFIMQNGNEAGVITKRWDGIERGAFTDADAFGVEFPQDASPETKALLLGAVFLIDFAHFERQ